MAYVMVVVIYIILHIYLILFQIHILPWEIKGRIPHVQDLGIFQKIFSFHPLCFFFFLHIFSLGLTSEWSSAFALGFIKQLDACSIPP